jgi:hypothetical protein
MDPFTMMMLGSAGAGVLGNVLGGVSKVKQDQNLANQQSAGIAQSNQRTDQNIGNFGTGSRVGANNMQNIISDARATAPKMDPQMLANYNTIAGSSDVGSSIHGRPMSASDAIGKSINDINYREAISRGYTPEQAQSFLARASLAQGASSGQGMSAAQLRDSDMQGLSMQNELRDEMRQRAMGLTPSLAQHQLLSGLDRAGQQQASLAAQQRGGMGNLLAQRNVAQMGGNAMQMASREGAMMALDERNQAQQQYGNLMAGMRADAGQRDITQAGFNQQTEQANLQKRLQDAQLAQQMNQFNAAQRQQVDQFNTGNQTNISLANAQAANQARAFGAQAFNQNQQFNRANELQTALAKSGMSQDAINRELAARFGINQGNVAAVNQGRALDLQNQMGLVNRGLDAANVGAFADRDAAALALSNPHMIQSPTRSAGLDYMGMLGQGLAGAGQMGMTLGNSFNRAPAQNPAPSSNSLNTAGMSSTINTITNRPASDIMAGTRWE